MHIGWIGGVESSTANLRRVAERAGNSIEIHTGDVRGRGRDGLAGVIARADLVVIVVDVNSHGAVQQAKELARKCGRPMVLVRRPSASVLERIMRSYAEPQCAAG